MRALAVATNGRADGSVRRRAIEYFSANELVAETSLESDVETRTEHKSDE
jgi:hypothetical protein